MYSMTDTLLSTALNPTRISVTESLLIALIGISLVFVVLAVLQFVIWLTGVIMRSTPQFAQKHPKTAAGWEKFKAAFVFKKRKPAAEPAVSAAPAQTAAGTCGELTLVKTEERDAAMIMAIVADAEKTPLNELRFKSIKRIDEGENK